MRRLLHIATIGVVALLIWNSAVAAANVKEVGNWVKEDPIDGWRISCTTRHQRHPPYADCNVTVPVKSDIRHWLDVGDNTTNILDFIVGLWDSVYVDIKANRNIQIFWHGGTPWEPELVQGFNRKYCGHWYDPFMWVKTHKTCSFKVSRFGPWAPIGHMKLLVADKLGLIERLPSEPLEYHIEYRTQFDASMIVWLIVGLVLWVMAPRVGRSRAVHVSTGTLIGALGGVLVILFVLSRVLPAGRRSAFLAASFSAVGVSMSWMWDSLRTLLDEYVMWVIICLLIGAFVGFGLSYKYKLDSTSQDLVTITLRVIASLFLFSSSNNGFASGGLVVLLILWEAYSYFIAWLHPEGSIPEWHEQRGHSQDGGMMRYTHDGPVETWQQPRSSMTPNRSYSNNMNNTDSIRHRSRSRSVSRAAAPIVTGVRNTPSRSISRTMPSSMTPSRFAQYKLMNERLGEDRASRFTVNGVGDYISAGEFERQQQLTTELELLKLREQLRQGGDYVNVLSPYAQRAVSRWVGNEPMSPGASDDESQHH